MLCFADRVLAHYRCLPRPRACGPGGAGTWAGGWSHEQVAGMRPRAGSDAGQPTCAGLLDHRARWEFAPLRTCAAMMVCGLADAISGIGNTHIKLNFNLSFL